MSSRWTGATATSCVVIGRLRNSPIRKPYRGSDELPPDDRGRVTYSMNCGPQDTGAAVTTLSVQKALIKTHEAPPNRVRATSQLAVLRSTRGLHFLAVP